MSVVDYLLNLHKEERIDALNKALNVLQSV